jgi:Reverse transcriptase (RNA-dependent DNA polymerase)
VTNGRGKSDRFIEPAKSPNNAERPAAEAMEGRERAKGNSPECNALRTQGRGGAPSALERVRQAARKDKKQRFTALLHHIYDVERLRAAYLPVKKDAAAGVDGETWEHFGETLEANLQDLSHRRKRGAYRARPVRRVYIPKVGKPGELRPLGVPALEDKLVQRATVEVLNAIYEQDFMGFSYGFRPGRSPHQALDALAVGIGTRRVNWVLDADIRKPETFNFLGFTHSCGKTRKGHFTVLRQTMRQRWQAKLRALKEELRRRMHTPIREQGAYLRSVLLGHFRYYDVPMNGPALCAFRKAAGSLWRTVLRRRSQGNHLPLRRMGRFIARWFPPARVCHPYPLVRLGVFTQGGSRMR